MLKQRRRRKKKYKTLAAHTFFSFGPKKNIRQVELFVLFKGLLVGAKGLYTGQRGVQKKTANTKIPREKFQ